MRGPQNDAGVKVHIYTIVSEKNTLTRHNSNYMASGSIMRKGDMNWYNSCLKLQAKYNILCSFVSSVKAFALIGKNPMSRKDRFLFLNERKRR